MAIVTGSKVSFKRNSLVKEDSTVVAFNGTLEEQNQQTTVIETTLEFGWNPSPQRVILFGLDVSKKYLFVSESELTEI